MDKYEERYHIKRSAGISEYRKDGSKRNPGTDLQAGHAEEWAAEQFGAKVNDSVTVTGDEGYDFKIEVQLPSGKTASLRVEAIWNGFQTGSTTKPRMGGNLLVNPDDPYRYRNSDIFVLVAGTIETGFSFLGWATKSDLKIRPAKNFGYGNRFFVPASELRSMDKLMVRECVN